MRVAKCNGLLATFPAIFLVPRPFIGTSRRVFTLLFVPSVHFRRNHYRLSFELVVAIIGPSSSFRPARRTYPPNPPTIRINIISTTFIS